MIYIAKRMQDTPEPRADARRGRLRPHLHPDRRGQHAARDAPRSGSRSWPRSSSSSGSRTCSATSRCRRTRTRRSTSSASSFPAFALYAATANLSVPLVLTLVVWFVYQVEGIRRHGLRQVPQGLAPGGRDRRRRGPDLLHRGDLAVRADHLALGATVRQHPRRPPADPVHGRRAGGAARASRRSAGSRCRWRSPSSCSRSAWSPRSRPSSSPRSRPSTSARQPPEATKEDPMDLAVLHSQSHRRPTRPTASRRSPSASAPASARSAPASASATSSAR